MKIGYLVPEFPSQTHVFFWREVVALREMGEEVRMVSTRRPPRDHCRHAFAEEGHRSTFYVYPPTVGDVFWLLVHLVGLFRVLGYISGLKESSLKGKVRAMGMALCAARLARFARREKLDHLHSHSCADAAHIVAMARLLGGPMYSLTLHGGLSTYGVDHASKFRKSVMISTDGGHLVDPIVAVGYPRERVLATCMGLDTTQFVPVERGDPERVLLVTVARLDKGKGHRYALEAISRLTKEGLKIRYVAAGRGKDEAEIKALAQQLGLLDTVAEFPGTRSEGEVKELLQSADVFVLSSEGTFEAYPISVMEAMSCGVPVVVSIIGATPEMVEDGRNGFLIKQGDVDALTDRLRVMVMDGARRREMGRAARARAEAGFDVKVTARKLLDFIEKWRVKEPG